VNFVECFTALLSRSFPHGCTNIQRELPCTHRSLFQDWRHLQTHFHRHLCRPKSFSKATAIRKRRYRRS